MCCVFKETDSKKVWQVKKVFLSNKLDFSRFLVVRLVGFCWFVVYINFFQKLHFKRFHNVSR